MKVLVTGATGFVGSWLTRRLVNDGYQVRILRRQSSDVSEISDLDLDHAIGDVTDYESLSLACQNCDAIFHLAGVVGYSKAMRKTMDLVNVNGTENVIKACIENKVSRLVYMSSVVAVGASFSGQPLNEESDYNVRHLNLGYFETKRAAEEKVISACQKGQIDAVILNPSTIYGPGDAKKGSRKVQLKVAKGKFPFYPPGGVNVISVHDVIEGILSAWKNGKNGERYILAGENLTIKQLFEIIASEAGSKPPTIPLPKPAIKIIGFIGDRLEGMGKKGPLNSENAWTSVLFHWFDSTKAQSELGLKPKSAKDAISESVQWIKDHGLLKENEN